MRIILQVVVFFFIGFTPPVLAEEEQSDQETSPHNTQSQQTWDYTWGNDDHCFQDQEGNPLGKKCIDIYVPPAEKEKEASTSS